MSQNIQTDRNTAVALGLHKFISDAPCKHGHVGLRYSATGACVACAKIAADRHHNKKHGPVIEIRVRVAKGDEEAVINTAKALALMRGVTI